MHRNRRKSIRLPESAYRDNGSVWLVSIATAGRSPVFMDEIFAGLVASMFEWRASEMCIGLDLYCLMPDHLHTIVQIQDGSLIDFIQDVKSRSTRAWWEHDGNGRLWQRSFHDKGLRTRESYEAAIAYVLNNPVEAGLVSEWQEYPLIGGDIVRRGDH